MRNFDFKRYTPRPKKLLRASLSVMVFVSSMAIFHTMLKTNTHPSQPITAYFSEYLEYIFHLTNVCVCLIAYKVLKPLLTYNHWCFDFKWHIWQLIVSDWECQQYTFLVTLYWHSSLSMVWYVVGKVSRAKQPWLMRHFNFAHLNC